VQGTEGKRAPVEAEAVEGDRSSEDGRSQGEAPVRMSRSVLAWGLFGLTVALLVSATVLSLGGGGGWGVDRLFVPVGFAGVGALIAVRTSNKVGWLFLAEGFAVALTIAAKDYAAHPGGTPLPGAPWVGWSFTIALNTIFPPLLLALLLFPDGGSHPPGGGPWPGSSSPRGQWRSRVSPSPMSTSLRTSRISVIR
jgi:hypothetical protein